MAKKRKNDYPSGTRTSWKVVITYTFVIALCAALFYYIFNLRSTIESQRSNINSQHAALEWANRFTKNVHEAQSAANLYAFTKQTRYKRRFNEAKKLISAQVDSIVMIEINEDNKTMVKEIDGLIKSKGSISNELSKQFHDFNPLAEFDRTIDDYMPPEPEEEIVVTKISKDTIIHVPRNQKKGFWRRIGNVFNPTEEDSIVHVSIESTDTLHIQRQSNDSLTILADLRLLSDQAKAEYWNKIKEYESKTQELVRADNQLSEQISNLLIHLNQEIMESRHKLLLSVSHDIKTPLSSILGNVELMDKAGNEKEFSSIQQSADHILNLLNNLLEYSSLEQGKLQIRNESFNLRQICDETAEMFRPIAKHKNLDFVYEPDMEEDSFILSDRLKIKQILSNIISNGIKYTLEGSVRFKARTGRNLVVFDITDTGVGIPPDKLEDVFKPFVRIETYNQFAEGSGYGMSVVKGLVDLLGGEIHIESEVGKGTHFEVRIPVGNVEKPIEEDGEVNCDKKKSLNILVIDDDNTLLSVIDTMLHRLGHQAIACRSKNDIESAIAQIHDYDYVLTDREMGALTGNDILHMFKEADPDKPVILMTARIEYSNEIAKEEGFDGFLQKPFNLKQLESLFGSVAVAESEQEIAFPDFPSFSEMMGNDRPSMTDILSVFVKSTSDDLMTMNALIEASDFIEMQALCHKMLPMFTQLERDTTFLSKMNGMRGKGDTEESYPNWKEDAIQFMSQADELLDLLAEKYGIE